MGHTHEIALDVEDATEDVWRCRWRCACGKTGSWIFVDVTKARDAGLDPETWARIQIITAAMGGL